MTTTPPDACEDDPRQIIEEFLRRDLVSAEATRRVERLRAENKPWEALDIILEDRRRRSGPR